jgi:hypothetical protein
MAQEVGYLHVILSYYCTLALAIEALKRAGADFRVHQKIVGKRASARLCLLLLADCCPAGRRVTTTSSTARMYLQHLNLSP